MLAKPQMWWPGINRRHPLAQGIELLYPFWGRGGTLCDVSGHRRNGILVGMAPATDWVGSPYGSALDFDGSNDCVEADHSDQLNIGTGDFTVASWIYHAATSIHDVWVSKGVHNVGWMICSGEPVSSLVLYVTGTEYLRVNDAGTAISGRWSYHCVLRRADQCEWWIDGVKQSFAIDLISGQTRDLSSSWKFRVGAADNNAGSASWFWKGKVAQIIFWPRRAIGIGDIHALYHNPFQLIRPPSIARLHVAAAPPVGIAVLRRRMEAA